MKRILAAFVLFLIGVYAFLSFIDTSDYVVEKRLWRAERQYVQLMQDPSVIPVAGFEALIEHYQSIIRAFPDSPKVPQIYLRIGQLQLAQQNPANARKTFLMVVTEFPDDREVGSRAMLLAGQSFEEEGKPEQALAVYKRLMKKFSLTQVGWEMPLYLVNVHMRAKREAEAAAALDDAMVVYRQLAEDNAGTEVGFQAMRRLATTYVVAARPRDAIKTLEAVLLGYASSPSLNPSRAAEIIQTINTLAINSVNEPDAAVSVYETFMEQHPKHPLSQGLPRIIAGMKALRK